MPLSVILPRKQRSLTISIFERNTLNSLASHRLIEAGFLGSIAGDIVASAASM